MTDTMDDHITVEQILMEQAREIARQSSRENNADRNLAPWGGRFSKDMPEDVQAAGKSGSC